LTCQKPEAFQAESQVTLSLLTLHFPLNPLSEQVAEEVNGIKTNHKSDCY
jgi:hypothetical protein